MNFDDPVVRKVYIEVTNRDMSLDDLAKKLQINRSTMYTRMHHPETFRLGELRSISKITGVEIGELVRGRR